MGGTGTPGPTGMQQGQAARRQQPIHLEPVTVGDVISDDPVTAQRDTPVRTAVAKMAEEDVGAVVVVDDDEPVGLVTDREVALALEDRPDIVQRNVGELASEEIEIAEPEMTVFDALQIMGDHGIRRLPVVDENGELQGVITLDDAIVLVGGEFGQIAETVQSQIEDL